MELYWYAYLHTNGAVKIKRTYPAEGHWDLDEQGLIESPFVERYTQPYLAENREDAEAKALALLGVTV